MGEKILSHFQRDNMIQTTVDSHGNGLSQTRIVSGDGDFSDIRQFNGKLTQAGTSFFCKEKRNDSGNDNKDQNH